MEENQSLKVQNEKLKRKEKEWMTLNSRSNRNDQERFVNTEELKWKVYELKRDNAILLENILELKKRENLIGTEELYLAETVIQLDRQLSLINNENKTCSLRKGDDSSKKIAEMKDKFDVLSVSVREMEERLKIKAENKGNKPEELIKRVKLIEEKVLGSGKKKEEKPKNSTRESFKKATFRSVRTGKSGFSTQR